MNTFIPFVEQVTGYKVRRWPRWLRWTKRSMTLPLIRRIYMAEHLLWDNPGLEHVVAHEALHAIRQSADRLWLLKYLLNPTFRLQEEVMGEAVEAARRCRHSDLEPTLANLRRCTSATCYTGGPYCLSAPKDETLDRIARHATGLTNHILVRTK